MQGDGDGWTRCALGHEHWGLHGAAGLLLRARSRDGAVHVLLQHRAPWSHHGNTWGILGGARDSDESVVAAALREAGEEAALDLSRICVRGQRVDDHQGWSYTTVLADTDGLLATRRQRESVELRWVPEPEVADLPLHPGFAMSWPGVTARPVTLVVDVANVVGSVPDGWWKDRAGAAHGLLVRLAATVGRTVELPDRGFAVVTRVVAVVEGAARAVADVAGVDLVRASGAGDDAVAEQAPGPDHVVVTADRALRRRLREGVDVAGPAWLRDRLGGPHPSTASASGSTDAAPA